MLTVTNDETGHTREVDPQHAPTTGRQAEDISAQLRQICRRDDTPESCRRNLARLLVTQPDVSAATIFDREHENSFRSKVPLIHRPEYSGNAKTWATTIRNNVRTVASSSAVRVLQLAGNPTEFTAILAPVVLDETLVSVVCLVVRSSPANCGEPKLLAQLAAAELAKSMMPADYENYASATGELLNTLLQVSAAGDMDRGYYEVARRLQDETDAHLVFLGVWNNIRRRCILRALSSSPRCERHSPLGACAEEVLNEAVLRKAMESHDGSDSAASATNARKRLSQLCQARGFLSGTIRDQNDAPLGAWVIVDKEGRDAAQHRAWATRTKTNLENRSPRLVSCLELLRHVQPSLFQQLAKSVFGPNTRSRRRAFLLVAVGLACLLAFPLPYRVKCDCEVQAVTRRFVPVAYDGVLHEVFVEPGDVVSAGQVLARMDGREIELERAAQLAEYNRSRKEYDVQLAAQDTSAAQVARLEMERLQLQIELLESRAENLDIRSPIDGIVIGGDPKKKEHARLKMGDTLFEIGPLDEMVVDVLVPDEDVAYVEQGQEVRIRLDAYPGAPRDGTVKRINPQAEVRGQDNVFVAEVELHNQDRALRPGMKGRSRVRTAVRPIAWNLFHKAWDKLVYHFAW